MSYKHTSRSSIKGIPIQKDDNTIVIYFDSTSEEITLESLFTDYLDKEVRISISYDDILVE